MKSRKQVLKENEIRKVLEDREMSYHEKEEEITGILMDYDGRIEHDEIVRILRRVE